MSKWEAWLALCSFAFGWFWICWLVMELGEWIGRRLKQRKRGD